MSRGPAGDQRSRGVDDERVSGEHRDSHGEDGGEGEGKAHREV